MFDTAVKLNVKEKSDNLMTGYESNRQLWDGTTWRTESNMHTDQVRSSYRNEFNKPKPFHLNKLKDTTGRLKKRLAVYDAQDNPTFVPQWTKSAMKRSKKWREWVEAFEELLTSNKVTNRIEQ